MPEPQSDLVAFITERLDHEQGDANLISSGGYQPQEWRLIGFSSPDLALEVDDERYAEVRALDGVRGGELDEDSGVVAYVRTGRNEHLHVVRYDPARVLRETAAHRRLLADIVAQQHWLNDRYYSGCSALAEALHPDLPDLPTGRPCSCGRDADVERRLRLLAAIWSDSPGFRSEWLIEENSTDG